MVGLVVEGCGALPAVVLGLKIQGFRRLVWGGCYGVVFWGLKGRKRSGIRVPKGW